MIPLERLQYLLNSDSRWIERSLLALYSAQTDDERKDGVTRHLNGRGFDGHSAELGSYLSRWILTGQPLTGRFVEHGRRIALRHIRQLSAVLAEEPAQIEQ